MIYPTGPETAKVMLVGEFPGEQELLKGQPFVGSTGFELNKILKEAGLFRESCFTTLVCRTRSPNGTIKGLVAHRKKDITPAHVLYNGKHVLPSVIEGIEQLKAEILLVKPAVVTALGDLALWALTGEWGVGSWRSSIMESTLIPGVKVIPSYAPGMIQSVWKWRSLLVHDLKRVKRQMVSPLITRPKYNFVIRPSYSTAVHALEGLIDRALHHQATTGTKLKVSIDIETRAGHISCIAFAWSALNAICIPLMCAHNKEGYWSAEEEAFLVMRMTHLMIHVQIIGQNYNYDAQYIDRHWLFIAPCIVRDTMIAQHSCWSNMPKNLSFLSSMYLEDHLHWKDDRTNWTVGPNDPNAEDGYWVYNCTDAVRTFAIDTVMETLVPAMGMTEVNRFQQELCAPVLRTMIRGLRIDETARANLALDLMWEYSLREYWMREVIGRELNINSPKQMREFFYDEMGQKEIISKKTKGVTCDDEALHTIAQREPLLRPITRKIAELRSLGVFHSSFVCAPLDVDGRIRTSFNVAGTDTYRFTASKNAYGTGLNAQTIPNGGETEDEGLELPNVRKLFIPDEGHIIFDIDLDSADARIVGAESQCAWMNEQFAQGRKLYVEVAKEYYHDQTITKHHKSYPMFKALCHGTHYLGTPEGIAPRIGLLVHETERIQRWYFQICPELKKWHDDMKKQITGRRYIENVFGYRRYFLDRIEGTVFNQGVAWIPQSTVACIINRAYINIDRNLPEVSILLQVHDSLMGEFKAIHGDWALRRIVEESRVSLPYDTPIIIPVGIKSSAKSWGDCK